MPSRSKNKKKQAKGKSEPIAKIQQKQVINILRADTMSGGKITIDCRKVFWISLGLMGFYLLYGAFSVGVAADEPIDYGYGKKSLAYFLSLGKDTSYASLEVDGQKFPDQKYYGAAFEMIAPMVNAVLNPVMPFFTHHLLCAIAGLTLLLFTGLSAQRLKGCRAGLLALWLIFLTPLITGNAFFNSKDIPFAAAFAAGLYYSICFFDQLPVFSKEAMIGMGLSVAAAVSIRISGLLLPIYIGGFALVWYLLGGRRLTLPPLFTARFLLRVGALLFAGTLLGFLTYPNFWHEGIAHIRGGLAATKHFEHNVFMLYNSELVASQKINTAEFIVHYLWMTLPEIILLGFPVAIVILACFSRHFNLTYAGFLLFGAVFPFVYVMIVKAPVYNGWRHLFFAYPFVVVITAIGISELFFLIKNKTIQYSLACVVLIMMIDLVVWSLRTFPYNYAYYNHISGGLKKIYAQYDIDYQQLAVREGFKWFLENEGGSNKQVTIMSNNAFALKCEFDSSETRFRDFAIKDMWIADWDYAVISPLFLNAEAIKTMLPPYGTLYTVKRMDVPFCFVVRRDSKEDLVAFRMFKHDSLDQAIPLVDHIFQTNKTNTTAWYWEACHLFKIGKYGESIELCTRYDKLFPYQDEIYELMGYNYYYTAHFDKALQCLGYIYKNRPDNKYYNILIADCLVRLGREEEAKYYYGKAKTLN